MTLKLWGYPRRYYNNNELEMIQVLTRFEDAGCRFVVGGRCNADGSFQTLADVMVRLLVPAGCSEV